MNNIFKNQKGMTIVEVLIASGLSAALALSIAKMMENSQKESKRLEIRSEANTLCAQISSVLSNWDAMANSFGPGVNISQITSPGTYNLPAIRDRNNNTIYLPGYQNPQKTLSIESMTVSRFQNTSGGTGLARFQIQMKNLRAPKGSTGAQFFKPCELGMNVGYNASNVITGGSTVTSGSGNIWEYVTDGSGIFYNGGGVEVGSSNTVAAGIPSLVVGDSNTANQIGSAAIGVSNIVTAAQSVGLGSSNTVNATTGSGGSNGPVGVIGIGTSNTVTCPQCQAIGYGNQSTSGRFNMVVGTNSRSTGSSSGISVGSWNHVNAQGAISIGNGNGNRPGNFTDAYKMSGTDSIIIGNSGATSATATRSIVIGNNGISTAAGNLTMVDNTGTEVTNNIANSFVARYAGGYTWYGDAGMTTTNSMMFKDGLLAVGENSAPNVVNSLVVGDHTFGTTGDSGSLIVGWAHNYNGAGAMLVSGQSNTVASTACKGSVIGWNNTIASCNTHLIGAANKSTSSANYGLGLGLWTSVEHSGATVMGAEVVGSYVASTAANQFTARYPGGYIFHGDGAMTAMKAVRFTNGAIIVGDTTNTMNASAQGIGMIGTFHQAQSNANSSLLVGWGNTINNGASFAMGQANSVTGANGTAMGWAVSISGDRSHSIGSNNVVSGDYGMALGVDAQVDHYGSMVLSTNNGGSRIASSTTNQFTARFQNGYRFCTNSGCTTGVSLAGGGTGWGIISDRNMKWDIKPLNAEDILKKFAELPMSYWKYKGQDIVHLGPMAQDFAKVFKGIGDGNDKVINTQEVDGLTMVAIQALEKRTRDLQKENDELKSRLARLETLVEAGMRKPASK